MAEKIQIVPTLLTHTFNEFKEKLSKCEKHFSLVQIDVMDKKFVDNKTFFDLEKIRKIKSYKGDYELHLMVQNPLTIIKKWERYKKLKKVVFHYEAMKDDEAVFDLIKYLQKKKIKAGLAINPETPVNKIIKFLPELDFVFLLGVQPGWSGQLLHADVLNKARRIRLQYPNLDIEIDGGVNMNNIPRIINSGINIIATGSLIFNSPDIEKTILNLKKLEK